MKAVIQYFILLSFLLLTDNITSLAQCPDYGTATDPKHKALNKGKNKSVKIPNTWLIQSLPLPHLINSVKKNDEKRYLNGAYVYTEGYLISAEEEGPETCNCNKATKKKKNGDVHIYLGLVPDAQNKKCIIVEITPAYKKAHPDYDEALVKNKKVRVEGLLLFDFEHKGNAINTCQSCGNVWRKTCWEIHPVTNITLID